MGNLEGEAVGTIVGNPEGEVVGTIVGNLEGDDVVGTTVGNLEGVRVGAVVTPLVQPIIEIISKFKKNAFIMTGFYKQLLFQVMFNFNGGKRFQTI